MMRKVFAASITALLIILLGAAIAYADATTPDEPTLPVLPITILEPIPGQFIGNSGTFQASWTQAPDTLFYRVQVFLPPGAQYEFIEHRYVPDVPRDIRFRPVRMLLDAGSLTANADH